MKKFVLRLDLQDDKEKRRALKTVSALPGIDEITIDIKSKKLTIIGTVDPVTVATKLRKFWPTDILLVGPAKEPEKKEEPKKEEAKKEEPKKEDAKEEPKKKEEAKVEPQKEEPKNEDAKNEPPKKEEEKKAVVEQVVGTAMPYRPYYPPMQTYYYMHHSIEENPNACVIS